MHTGSFMVPQSSLDYSARYIINDNGVETVKEVWRSGQKMRLQFSSGQEGGLGFYFLGNRAYSCRGAGPDALCFDISAGLSKKDAEIFFAPPDLSGAKEAEEVAIGNTKGRCYIMPTLQFETRKVCLTDRGVVAYDEQNATGKGIKVEYLTDIAYFVGEADFELPAEPRLSPSQNNSG